jgi:hypothetical protein
VSPIVGEILGYACGFCTTIAFLPQTIKSIRTRNVSGLSCLSYSEVIGTWRPLDSANPYSGKQNEVSQEPELKVEVRILSENLDKTLIAIKAIHPYETPVINIILLSN